MCPVSRGCEFQTEGAAQEKERCPYGLVLACGMPRVLEYEEEEVKKTIGIRGKIG